MGNRDETVRTGRGSSGPGRESGGRAKFEHAFLDRFGLGLRRGGDVCGQSLADGDEDRVHGCLDSARPAAHWEVDRFLPEELLQHAELRAIQREWDDREGVFTTLLANGKSVP